MATDQAVEIMFDRVGPKVHWAAVLALAPFAAGKGCAVAAALVIGTKFGDGQGPGGAADPT